MAGAVHGLGDGDVLEPVHQGWSSVGAWCVREGLGLLRGFACADALWHPSLCTAPTQTSLLGLCGGWGWAGAGLGVCRGMQWMGLRKVFHLLRVHAHLGLCFCFGDRALSTHLRNRIFTCLHGKEEDAISGK